MADTSEKQSSEGNAPDGVTETRDRHIMRWLVVGVILLAGLVIAWLLGSAVIPRWWAQRIGNIVDKSLFRGGMLGVATGAVFTFLPLVILRLALRFRRGWKSVVAFVIAAAIVAAPNLFTLGIVLGSGNAAHAGQRILDVDGPGFRAGSLAGAIGAALGAGWLGWLLRSRRKSKDKARDLERTLTEAS